jgi:hypothetical protein
MGRAQAVMIQRFLNSSSSQLTSHGRSRLISFPSQTSSASPNRPSTEPTPLLHSEPPLFALFRKSHISVLYRHAGVLYTLVTDQRFLNDSGVVWERLRDIDQDVAEYFDSNFQLVHPDALGTVDQEYVLHAICGASGSFIDCYTIYSSILASRLQSKEDGRESAIIERGETGWKGKMEDWEGHFSDKKHHKLRDIVHSAEHKVLSKGMCIVPSYVAHSLTDSENFSTILQCCKLKIFSICTITGAMLLREASWKMLD